MKYTKEDIEKLGFDLIPATEVKVEKVDPYEDEYVYDLEVADGSHTFLGNGFLLHNSIYVRMDNILKILFGKTDIDWNNPKVFEKIKKYVDTKFQDLLNNHVAEFICNKFKTDQKRIEFKREKISSEGEYIAKKHYVVHVRNNEGIDCDKFAYTGVDIAKNELPSRIKSLLKDCVQGMIQYDWAPDKINQELKRIYDIYKTLPLEETAYIKNLNTPKNVTGFLKMEKGAGVHARAAEAYNQLIEKLELTDKNEKIDKNDRFHYFYTKLDNVYGMDCIAWKDRYPKEFEKIFEIDRDKMFEKQIISPLKLFLEDHHATAFDPNNLPVSGEDGKSVFDL